MLVEPSDANQMLYFCGEGMHKASKDLEFCGLRVGGAAM